MRPGYYWALLDTDWEVVKVVSIGYGQFGIRIYRIADEEAYNMDAVTHWGEELDRRGV